MALGELLKGLAGGFGATKTGGNFLFGGQKIGKPISSLTPQQQQAFSQLISQLSPSAISSFGQYLQPMGPENYEDIFQRSYVQPAEKAFQQSILPSIQQSFSNEGMSGALNQALAQAAGNLSTDLGAKYGDFYQNQQKTQLAALSQFLPFLTQSTFTPNVQQQQGILSDLIRMIPQLAMYA